MSREKRLRILTRDLGDPLPWSTDPTTARRIYQRIYRASLKSNSPEDAIAEHLGFKKKRR